MCNFLSFIILVAFFCTSLIKPSYAGDDPAVPNCEECEMSDRMDTAMFTFGYTSDVTPSINNLANEIIIDTKNTLDPEIYQIKHIRLHNLKSMINFLESYENGLMVTTETVYNQLKDNYDNIPAIKNLKVIPLETSMCKKYYTKGYFYILTSINTDSDGVINVINTLNKVPPQHDKLLTYHMCQ